MYERFFNYSNELLCIADLNGNFIEVNDSFSRLLGYPKEHLVSHKIITFIHPDDIDNTILELQKLSMGEQTVNFENRYIDSTGSIHIFSWKAFPEVSTGHIYAVARDVTQERLHGNSFAQLHKAIFENVIYVKTNLKGEITEVNDKFCNISGYSREEMIGQTHKIVNSGLHTPSFFNNLWSTISSGKVWSGPITNRKKTGELYYVHSIITPMFNIQGQIDSFVAMRFDITDRVEFKKESEKILRILNETSSIAKVGGWELDIQSGALSWTDETFKILGVTKTNGRTPELPEGISLFIEEHQAIINNAVLEGTTKGTPYALELKVNMPTGEEKWIFTNGMANYVDGEITTLSGTIQDIHDKKLAELRYNQERQKNIQNAKFAALGELAASIAHEINNPLGIISGYTELLKYKNVKEDESKLDTILKSCERISYIVKSLKRFSRSENAPTKMALILSDIAHEAISLTSSRMKTNIIKFSSVLDDKSKIWANDIEIEQVIINLINNSIDAVKEDKECWIKLSIYQLNNNVILDVEDSGEGVPKDIQLKMFEPFYTTKEINKGTGLGLSVVRGILADHGATIEVSDAQNTCFRITFANYK